MSSDSKPTDSDLPEDTNPDEADFWDDVVKDSDESVLDTSKIKADNSFEDLEALLGDSDGSITSLEKTINDLNDDTHSAEADETEDLLGSLDSISRSAAEDVESLPELEELDLKAMDIELESGLEPEEVAENSKALKEKIAIIATLSTIVIVGSLLVLNIADKYTFEKSMAEDRLVSATGEFASIDGLETWWSDPENVVQGVRIVPTARITLDDDSKSGAIRVVFRSFERNALDQFKPKGDSITKTFTNGKFDENGESSITVACSDGFTDESEFHFYRNQDEERWTVEVREAKYSNVSARAYKKLAYAPIDPVRK